MIEDATGVHWISASAAWTEPGTRLEVRLYDPVGPQHSLAVARALDSALPEVVSGFISFEVQDTLTNDENYIVRHAGLVITAADLWASDPVAFRDAVDAAVAAASASYQAEASANEDHMTEWMRRLRFKP